MPRIGLALTYELIEGTPSLVLILALAAPVIAVLSLILNLLQFLERRHLLRRDDRPNWFIEEEFGNPHLRTGNERVRLESATITPPEGVYRPGEHDHFFSTASVSKSGRVGADDLCETVAHEFLQTHKPPETWRWDDAKGWVAANPYDSSGRTKHSTGSFMPVVVVSQYRLPTHRATEFAVYDAEFEFLHISESECKPSLKGIKFSCIARSASRAQRLAASKWRRQHWDVNKREVSLMDRFRQQWREFNSPESEKPQDWKPTFTPPGARRPQPDWSKPGAPDETT